MLSKITVLQRQMSNYVIFVEVTFSHCEDFTRSCQSVTFCVYWSQHSTTEFIGERGTLSNKYYYTKPKSMGVYLKLYIPTTIIIIREREFKFPSAKFPHKEQHWNISRYRNIRSSNTQTWNVPKKNRDVN